jgi:hypothetical protein
MMHDANRQEMHMGRRRDRKLHRSFLRKQPRKFCVVYGLYDMEGRLRYIGQTRQLLSERLRWFWKQIARRRDQGRKLTPVERWLDECSYFQMPVEIRAIDENATWDVSEIIYIDRARQRGEDLLNILRGGQDTL